MAELLKTPNTRGDGWSKVALVQSLEWAEYATDQVVVKTQRDYHCRPLWNALRKTPLVRREQRALIRLRALGIAVPLVLEYKVANDEAVLVTSFIENAQALDEALNSAPTQRLATLGSAARLVGQLHRTRWTHGALYPVHILITHAETVPKAHLIDLEKAKYLGNRTADLARFWRHVDGVSVDERNHFEQVYAGVLAGEVDTA